MVTSTTRLLVWLTVAFIVSPAQAVVTSFSSFSQWQSAAGSFTTIDFTDLSGTILGTEYASLGVTFTGGDDVVGFGAFTTFPLDGAGAIAFDEAVEMAFSQPMTSIGAHFPGGLQIELYRGGSLIHSSAPSFGPPGSFFGLTSSQPFDAAILHRPDDGVPNFYMDNLYFGPAIPAPAGVGLLLLGCRQRRKRV